LFCDFHGVNSSHITKIVKFILLHCTYYVSSVVSVQNDKALHKKSEMQHIKVKQ